MRRGATSILFMLGVAGLCLVVAGAWLAPGSCQAANPFKGEFMVNSTTSDSQNRPAVARLASGGFVVSWASRVPGSEDADIRAQIYDNDAVPVGGEILVFGPAAKSKMTAVAPVNGGGFAVLWDVWASDANGYDIHGRIFDGQGNPTVGPFYLATGDTNDFLPRAIGLENGHFAVVWNSSSKDSSADGDVYFRLYDGQGNGVGELRKVNSSRAHRDSVTSVVGLPGSNCMVVWDGISFGYDGWNVSGQRFDSQGQPSGDNFVVHRGVSGIQWNPSATVLKNGKVVVVWVLAKDDALGDIYGRVFDQYASPQGNEFIIAADAARDNTWPDVAALEAEDYVVVWDQATSNEGRDIRAQRLYGNGNLFEDQFRVNSHQAHDQDHPRISSRNGGYVVVWESFQQDGDGFGVYGQLYY